MMFHAMIQYRIEFTDVQFTNIEISWMILYIIEFLDASMNKIERSYKIYSFKLEFILILHLLTTNSL